MFIIFSIKLVEPVASLLRRHSDSEWYMNCFRVGRDVMSLYGMEIIKIQRRFCKLTDRIQTRLLIFPELLHS